MTAIVVQGFVVEQALLCAQHTPKIMEHLTT